MAAVAVVLRAELPLRAPKHAFSGHSSVHMVTQRVVERCTHMSS